MPGLIWNMMMSVSGGWFFVVASEAITVGDTDHPARHRLLHRPAIDERNLGAIGMRCW
jgi:NitT/TauT family transport system permease protein